MVERMPDGEQGGDSLKYLVLSSLQSTGFWSFVAAVVGVVALLAGGAMYFTVEELREFSVSVIVIGIVLVFLALVLSPRAIAIFLVGRQGRYGSNIVVLTTAFFIIVLLVNFLLYRNPTRVDVTATRIFTLSEQTVQILEGLDGLVRANAFFVPSDTRSAAAQQQAEDMLNEFTRRSNMFSYRFVDPELQRSVAQQYGVDSFPAIVFEDLEEGTLQNVQSFTEQDFVTSILIVSGAEQKIVYYLTGHDEAGSTRDVLSGAIDEDNGLDYAIGGMQRDNYRVLPLNLKQEARVPEDAALVVIAGPKQDLDQEEFAALDAYLKGGGRMIALFDPATPDTFNFLVAQWGILLATRDPSTNKPLSIADAVSNVAGEELTPLLQKANVQYSTSTSPTTKGIPIADQIDVTFFPEATAVDRLIPVEETPPFVRILPIAMTTPASWLESNTEEVNFDAGEERLGPFPVAVVVEAEGTIDESLRHPVSKFVVFGDSDFAKNKFFASSDNADLFLNSVNWLADDYELISIRPKVFPYRELVVTTRERDFIKWSSWFVPPVIMLIIGAAVWWRRR
jgi:hypothetical protein